MAKKGKTVAPRDADGKKIQPGEFEIQNPDKFIWSGEDVDGLHWLDDHEYTGTVPPGQPSGGE